jgi:hypothetical protein
LGNDLLLRLAIATDIVKHEEVALELDEVKQLKAMITQAIKTGQSSKLARRSMNHRP